MARFPRSPRWLQRCSHPSGPEAANPIEPTTDAIDFETASGLDARLLHSLSVRGTHRQGSLIALSESSVEFIMLANQQVSQLIHGCYCCPGSQEHSVQRAGTDRNGVLPVAVPTRTAFSP